jgi:hypothetical protein
VEPVKVEAEPAAPEETTKDDGESLLDMDWLPEWKLPSLMQEETTAEPVSPAPAAAKEEEKLPARRTARKGCSCHRGGFAKNRCAAV